MYDGNPLRAHAHVPALMPFEDRHFERWLDLVFETVDERFASPTAERAKTRAAKMNNAMRRIGKVGDGAGSPSGSAHSIDTGFSVAVHSMRPSSGMG